MLDWMKKLFKKEEEEQHAPDVLELARYSYKQERDVQQEEMPQRAGGKFRFPIDARDVQAELRPRETTPEPVQPVESLLYIQREKTPEPPVYSTVRPQRRELDLPEVPVLRESPRRPEVPPRRLEPPVLPGKPEAAVPPHRPEPPVLPRKAEQAPAAETRKRPFRLTETISPVFGYKRPSYDLHRKQPPTDLVLSANSRSVVDAWLEKHGLLPPEEEIDLAERTTAAAEEEPYAYAEHEAAAEAEEEEEPYAYAEHEAAMEAEEVFHVYAERGAEPEAEEELHVYAERGVEPEEFAEAEEEPHAYAEREAEPEAAAEAEEEELQVYAE
ncbi:hypothetical protein NK662_02885, partial [Ectobacillus sp. SYSU M60031]|nr:hypothetical protein [Ectobacillus ponti]